MNLLKKLSVATAGAAFVALGTVGVATSAKALTLTNTEPNDTFGTAQNINGFFSTEADPNIENSTTIPHVTINGTGNDTYDYFRFTTTADNSQAIFDIDDAWKGSSGGSSFDSMIYLFDNAGTFLAENDDNSASDGAGSISGLDSYINFTLPTAGDYVLAVGRCCEFISNGQFPSTAPVPSGATYAFQVSVANASDATAVPFEFSPSLGILALGALGGLDQLKRQLQKRKLSKSEFSIN